MLAQGLVGEPAAGREVGQQDPRVVAGLGDQRGQQLPPAVGAQVDLDRALALVEARPEQADAIVGHRPAVAVQASTDLVEADHVGAELGQGHAAERGGDVRRSLDHAQAVQDSGHLLLLQSGEDADEGPVEHLLGRFAGSPVGVNDGPQVSERRVQILEP